MIFLISLNIKLISIVNFKYQFLITDIISLYHSKFEFSFYLLLIIIRKIKLTSHMGETPNIERDIVCYCKGN